MGTSYNDMPQHIDDIIESIGETESKKVQYIIDRLRTLEGHESNCATVALHLLGSDESGRGYDKPMAVLWENYSDLIFMQQEQSDPHIVLPGVDTESELKDKPGYALNPDQPYFFKIALKEGQVLDLIQIQRMRASGNNDQDAIIDPISNVTDEDERWSRIKKMVDEYEVVSELTYRIRPSDSQLQLGEFHQSTFFTNNGKYYCIDKFKFGKRPQTTLSEINRENFMDFVKPFQQGLHFFATGGENMPQYQG